MEPADETSLLRVKLQEQDAEIKRLKDGFVRVRQVLGSVHDHSHTLNFEQLGQINQIVKEFIDTV